MQTAPQRSTQYTSLVDLLAPYELQLSKVGQYLTSVEAITLGGQTYLRGELSTDISALPHDELNELGLLATGRAYFVGYEELAGLAGPFLKPIDVVAPLKLPPSLVTARRYKGKTNEILTRFMCNLARFSSDFADRPWSELSVFDPLAGGGTTVFSALALGATGIGIEQNKKSAHGTAVFLRQYLQDERISHQVKEEKLKKGGGQRWWFEIGKSSPLRCVINRGEIVDTKRLLAGCKPPHFLVGDLPYGIQHKGGLADLLETALPIWQDVLQVGGVMVLSWESGRFTRADMVDAISRCAGWQVLTGAPYDRFGHRVDRAIKSRDIVVARNVGGS